MSVAELPQLQDLTVEEKLDLISKLLDSIEQERELPLLDEDERRILDERVAAHEADPGSALTLEEFNARLAARLGRRS